MVVNTLKISFCADHSWREGARQSSGERRRKGGEKRRGKGALKKIDITHKEKKTEGEGFALGLAILWYICFQTVHIVVPLLSVP